MLPTSSRVFERQHLWRVTPDLLREATTLLACAVLRDHGPVDNVIGIAEGGTVPAHVIASALGTRAGSVRARHNTSSAAYERATGTVHLDLKALVLALKGKRLHGRVLLVDDICGSGATLRRVIRDLGQLLAPDAQLLTATLCLNSGATTLPDYSIWMVSDWVVFPWEKPPADGDPEPLPIPTKATSHA
ncbi:MAG: putative phosphoribosyltransferase [Amycolatopsis sp.]|uniref:phosphoribosyltransferase n=1 Tax=Amycolatopsis sp. TaxID=37632 RepID=UPI00260EB83D|nr:phosphoribosyltransferase family protein [Amycolatopsis sp.]MCU1680245.1 putative phosphoribosyltransferase [Amycolatopsis sp.]